MSGKSLTSIVLAVLATFVSGSESAAQVWSCHFTINDGSAKGLDGEGRIRIVDRTLYWEPAFGRPSDGADAATTFEFLLLEDNRIGIVAASGIAENYEAVGDVIGARILTVSRKNGQLHLRSVLASGKYDLLTGNCSAQ
jgi:hypothetical protein